MPLIHNTYGKGRVRIMRVGRGEQNEVRELSVQTMLDGEFAEAYTKGDNRKVVATDTVKNITNIVAREALTEDAEIFGQTLAKRFLTRYPHVERVTVTMHETKWTRATIAGSPHAHTFLLDPNGKPYARVTATRSGTEVTSGIMSFTFMKSTQGGWVDFLNDEYTTLPDTSDRIVATAMDSTWTWNAAPSSYPAANAKILSTMLEVFATTYSYGVQDSLYRMGEAALGAVPELQTISMSCPNKHYLPLNLDRFGLSADNMVFTPTDEPHGQIECTVGRAS